MTQYGLRLFDRSNTRPWFLYTTYIVAIHHNVAKQWPNSRKANKGGSTKRSVWKRGRKGGRMEGGTDRRRMDGKATRESSWRVKRRGEKLARMVGGEIVHIQVYNRWNLCNIKHQLWWSYGSSPSCSLTSSQSSISLHVIRSTSFLNSIWNWRKRYAFPNVNQ